MKTDNFTTTRLRAVTVGFCLFVADRAALADTLNSTADTRTLNVAGNTNDGAGGNLSLYNNPGNTQYSWINFNLGGYAGQTITSDVTVTVRADTLGGPYPYLTGAAIHESNGSWAEGTLTWNNSPSFTQITSATNPANGNYTTGNNVSWTVPAYVAQKWIDDGFNGVVLTSGNTSSLHLSSANAGFAPTLSFTSAITNADGTWISGSNGNWTTDANWSGSTHARGIDQTATFNGSTGVTVTLDADRTVGALSFDNANYTIGGSEVLSLNRSSGTPSITVGNTGGTRTATISVALAGNEGLTKNGAGNLVLGGSNLYSGTTTATGGTVTLNTTTSLGAWAAHPLTIYGGGKIESNWGAGNFNDLGALNLGASGQAGGELASLQSGHNELGNYILYGDVTVAGTSKSTISADVRVIYNQTRVFNVGSTGDPSGTDLLISGKIGHYNGNSWGYFEKTGSGTMKITGVNEVGAITVTSGKLILENGAIAAMHVNGLVNNNLTELSVTTGNTINWSNNNFRGAGTYTKTGAGTLNATSFSNSHGNQTAVILDGGTLHMTGGHNNYWSVNSTTINSGAKLSNNTHSHIGAITLNGGELASTATDGFWGGWMLDQDVSVVGTGTSVISADRVAVANASNVSRVFTVAGTATLNVTGRFEDAASTTNNGVTKAGAGTMILAGNNVYTGLTTVNDGLLIVQNGNGIGDLSNVTLNNSSQLRLDANESVGSLAGSATSTVNLQGNTLQLGDQVGNATTTYDGVISGSGGLVRRGSGIQTLTGNNSFSGSVTVQDGGTLSVPTVAASGNQPLGVGTGNISLVGSGGGAALAITGPGTYDLPSARGLALSGTGGILSVTAGTLNMAGSITGNTTFTKSGAGTFNFSGDGSWSGNFTVSAGTFNLTGGGSILGVGSTTVGGTLNINTTASMQAASIDILSGGAVNLDAGTLRVGGGGLGVTGRSIDNAGGSFTWGSGTLAVYTTGSGEAGLTDRTGAGGSPSGPAVKEGNYLSVAGSLNAPSGSTLDLGSTYLSNGLRYNQLNVDGNLTLNDGTLNIGLSPYFLRPNTPDSVTVGDWGTMVLVYAEGTMSGTFAQLAGKTVIPGISNDGIGWTQLADIEYTGGGTPFDPSTLNLNEWVIEYRDGSGGNGFNFTQSPGAVVLLHYKVAGSVPEPASAGLLVAGTLLLRALRRRG